MADINPYLDIIRNATNGDSVRDAIINCMNEINKDTAFTVTDKVISGKISEINNGSPYTAPSGQVWKHVTLNIQQESGEDYPSSNVKVVDFEVNDYTENGEYNAGENERYGTIIVNVSHAGEWDGIIDNVKISTEDLDDYGTYHASTQGYTAVKSLTFTNINVPASRGGEYVDGKWQYPVIFINDAGEVVDKQYTTNKGSVQYTGPIPPDDHHEGTFSGWSPSPYGITGETKCYAQYDTGSGEPGFLTESWAELKTKGSSKPLGSIKTLVIPGYDFPSRELKSGLPWYEDGEEFAYKTTTAPAGTVNISVPMMLVAKGEGSSSTTWLATKPVYSPSIKNKNTGNQYNTYTNKSYSGYQARLMIAHDGREEGSSSGDWCDDWGTCWMNQWLNLCFFKALPDSLQSDIVAVPKKYRGIPNPTQRLPQEIYTKTISDCKLWLPALGEMASYISGVYSGGIETGCVDYYANAGWRPDVTNSYGNSPYRIHTRSLYSTGTNHQACVSSAKSDNVAVASEVSNYDGSIFEQYNGQITGFYLGFCL